MTGQQSKNERQMLADKFRCHCYQGYEGERCDSIEPEETEEDNMIKEDVEEEEGKKKPEDDKGIQDSAVPLQNTFILTVLLLFLNFSSI